MRKTHNMLRWFFRLALAMISLIAVTLVVSRWYAQHLPEASGEAYERVAFTGVNVVDVSTGSVRPHQSILVEQGRIVAVGSAQQVAVPTGYRHVDKSGLFVIPGFWDMHVHFNRLQEHYAGPMQVMHGVFYTRNMSGDCVGDDCLFDRRIEEVFELQRQIESGELLAPHFVEIGSFFIRGPRGGQRSVSRHLEESKYIVPLTEEDGRQLARYLHLRGVDFLKTYDSLPPDALRGLVREGRKLGLYVGGHVPKAMTLSMGLAAGMRSIEHARMLPLACSGSAEEYAERYHTWALSDPDGMDEPKIVEFLADILASPDEEACDALLADWARRDAYYVPTHLTRLADAVIAGRPFRGDPRASYVPSILLDTLWEDTARHYEDLFDEDADAEGRFRQFFDRGVHLTGRAHEAGVKLLVGTDVGDTLVYPGSGFHEEMQIYADAGLASADILRAATLSAAEFAGLAATHGSIASGRQADLVFLSADPLRSIAHTEAIESLYYNGRYYDAAAREQIMRTVADKSRGLRQYLMFGWFMTTRFLPFVALHGMPGGDAH